MAIVKRIAIFLCNYLKLFLMPVMLAAFIGGCLYRLCLSCIRGRPLRLNR